jgi:glycosyltransferase involved in cell wall biosynthesis
VTERPGHHLSTYYPVVTSAWAYLPVALVSPLYPPATGGVERHVERLAQGLRDRGVPIEVVTTDPTARDPSVDTVEGIVVRRFPTIRDDRVYFPSPLLARWLGHHAGRYALLHGHNLHTLVPMAAAWASRSTGTPLILTPHWHGTGHTSLRRLLHVPYRPVAGAVVRRSSALLANSAGEAALLRRDFGERLAISVIPPGIDLPAAMSFDGAETVPVGEPGATTILSVGRLETYKGIERLVAAMTLLPAATRLVVIGQGSARDAIAGAVAAAGLEERVMLRGRVPDDELHAWYGRADLFVSLSAHEAFGLTVLEAAAAGLPVVASDIPAHRESRSFLPDDRITLVPADGGPQAVAHAITSALGQGRATDQTGWTLPTWDGLVDAVVAAYRRVLPPP